MSENPFTILTGEAVPDSRVEVEAVIVGGRARVRRRRAVTATAAGVVVAVAIGAAALAQPRPAPRPDPVQPAPSASAVACAPVKLDELGAPALVAVSADGRHVVGTGNGGPVTVVGPQGIRTPGTVPRLLATGVNSSGTIVGNVERDDDTEGYVIESGVTIRLGKPPGALNVRAGAINDAGDIVGDARMPGNTFRAVVWRPGKRGLPDLLPTPAGGQAGGQSAAHGIAADGRIVGSIGNGAVPYLWLPDGTGRTLPLPTGKPGGIAVRVVGDWADGPVNYLANTTLRPNGRRVGLAEPAWARWNLRTGEVREVDAGHPIAGAAGLLADGTVVVNLVDAVALWTDAGVTRLPVPKGTTQIQVTGVGADGTLVGTAGGAAYRWSNCR